MIDTKTRQPTRDRATRRRFLANVAARLAAMALWKIGLAVVLALGVGAVAATLSAASDGTASPQPVSTGVVLTKLSSLGDFQAADAQYTFNFTYVVHKSFLFLTGESIHVTGTGADDAFVDFSGLTVGQVLRPDATSVSLILPKPQYGVPTVNLKQTTLTEKSGLFTHLSHVFKDDPGDAKAALSAAQAKIAYAARDSGLLATAEAGTRVFLTKFLARLGFKHVAVTFI